MPPLKSADVRRVRAEVAKVGDLVRIPKLRIIYKERSDRRVLARLPWGTTHYIEWQVIEEKAIQHRARTEADAIQFAEGFRVRLVQRPNRGALVAIDGRVHAILPTVAEAIELAQRLRREVAAEMAAQAQEAAQAELFRAWETRGGLPLGFDVREVLGTAQPPAEPTDQLQSDVPGGP